MENKRIVFLTLSLWKGGAESQLVKLAIFFKNRGFEVDIVNVLPQNDFQEELLENGIRNHYFKVKSFSGFFGLLKFIRHKRPDLLVSFMYGANLIARFLKLTFGIPIITSVRSSSIAKWYAGLYRVTYNLDDITTFNSRYMLEKFVENKWTNPTKSRLVENAIKIGDGTKRGNDGRNTKTSFRIISIAHIKPQKDYDTLLGAIQILDNSGEDIVLDILGHTFGSDWAFKRIAELEIAHMVKIRGFVKSNEKYLETADALVLSSFGEGSPNAILEAMALKVPVVASNVPGCSKLINESDCGFLFECGNADDLANKIVALKNLSISKRMEMGENGYKYVIKNYDETNVLEEWFSLVNKILLSTV